MNESQSYNLTWFFSGNYEFWLSEVVELDISHNKLENIPNFDGF